MTRKLLEWNKELIKQGEGSKGRTPLHFVASSWGREQWRILWLELYIKIIFGVVVLVSTYNMQSIGYKFESYILHHVFFFFFIFLQPYSARETGTMTKLLLDADESSAYQPDDEGLFPIHVAVLQCNLWVVEALLQKCPDCAQLRDTTQGRTVVHAAAIEGHWSILDWALHFLRDKYASQLHKFASIMNMRDNEGNTALHHAVKSGSIMTVYTIIWRKEVQLNIQNNKGQTALDVARSMGAQGVFYILVRNLFIFFIHTH